MLRKNIIVPDLLYVRARYDHSNEMMEHALETFRQIVTGTMQQDEEVSPRSGLMWM